MDMSALTFINTESTRPTAQSSTLIPATIPEAYYDYIPRGQRGVNDEAGAQVCHLDFFDFEQLRYVRW